jgi:GT2 family glycosyltransferase
VASFDDDSFPLDKDYFARLSCAFARFPQAAVVGASFFEHGDAISPATPEIYRAADFTGCAVAYRRDAFLATQGYVSRPIAYGVEEVDVALQLHEKDLQILWTPFLRVFHDTDLSNRASAHTSASVLANLGLVVFLRYPFFALPLGVWPCVRYGLKLLASGQITAVLRGVGEIGPVCWRYRDHRHPVTIRTLMSYLRLRRRPELVGNLDCQ